MPFKLFQSVKNVKAIQFWNISPLDHLLARLATDKSQKICQKVTQLLFRSFFPIDQVPFPVNFSLFPFPLPVLFIEIGMKFYSIVWVDF